MKYVDNGQSSAEIFLPSSILSESAKLFQSYYSKEMTQDEVIEALDQTWKDYNAANK